MRPSSPMIARTKTTPSWPDMRAPSGNWGCGASILTGGRTSPSGSSVALES
jgi:hypothetical protein